MEGHDDFSGGFGDDFSEENKFSDDLDGNYSKNLQEGFMVNNKYSNNDFGVDNKFFMI